MQPHRLLTGLALVICTSCGNDDWENACSVEKVDEGAEITCPNGSTAIIKDGDDGKDGVNGTDGQNGGGEGGAESGTDDNCIVVNDDGEVRIECPDGTNGDDGKDGTSCTVVDTDEGATISCTDGTSVDIADGQDGDDGANGKNGANGVDGTDGVNGIDGVNCTVTDTAAGATVTCGGVSVAIADGADGADGTDGTDGQDGLDGLQEPPVFSSGSRLELVQVAGADGSSYSTSYFWDTLLGVKCTPSYHADGSIRCLPQYQPYTSTFFADDACSIPVAIDAYSGSTPPKYVVQSAGTSDLRNELWGQSRVFSIGAKSSTAYINSSGSCLLATSITYDVYLIGSEVPSSTFVEFTQQ